RPDTTRARGPPAGRRGSNEPPDRRCPVHQREHGRRPRLEHPRQAGRGRARRGSHDRDPPGPYGLTVVSSHVDRHRRTLDGSRRRVMATVETGLQTQIRNIETQYGRSMAEWTELIRASGLTRHGQIVSMLKADHGLSHGSANRVALV